MTPEVHIARLEAENAVLREQVTALMECVTPVFHAEEECAAARRRENCDRTHCLTS